MTRVAASVQATRTFDLTVQLSGASHSFLNLNREEQKYLEPYFKSKKIRIRNDLNDNGEELLKKALSRDDISDSEQESSDAGDRPGGDEDEDSEEDEDFQDESEDDDVAEEYDENARGSDSEEEGSEVDDDGDDDEDEDEEEEEEEKRPAKKAKTKR